MLSGIKILSFTHYLQGPYGVQLLADLGADVVKIEPVNGVFERYFSSQDAHLNGVATNHLASNRNQRSIAVDIKTPEGMRIVERLVEDADVLIQNYRPGALDKLGLGCGELRRKYPRLVYCSISGYGSDGPYAQMDGQDLLAQGMGGLAYVSGRSDQPPVALGTSIVDAFGAVLAAYGVLAALMGRAKTGEGCHVESCLLNAAIAMQPEAFAGYFKTRKLFDKVDTGGVTRQYDLPYGIYETADDHILVSKIPLPVMREVFGEETMEGLTEENFFAERVRMDAVTARELKKRTTAEWLEILGKHKKCRVSKIHDYDDILANPQVRHNGVFLEMDHPVAGKTSVVGNPVHFDGEPPPLRRMPPMLGEHSVEIMRECGFSQREIEDCLNKGVIACDMTK